MKILVTGGAGYIGSHTVIELLANNYEVVIVDNLSNSSYESIERIEKITKKKVIFFETDICNKKPLIDIFSKNKFDAVIHFAGLKAVGESVKKPLLYYSNNIKSTINLLEVMEQFGVEKLVFSSSATVYGSASIPYLEDSITGQGISSPYGQTKYMIEQIIKDYAVNHPKGTYTILRYFNPIGAHDSGMIGENPKGIPNNIMPFITQVASGALPELSIFGNDYPTPDGTCIRDYIHVVDLAKGHLSALVNSPIGVNTFNLGSGIGISVLELVNIFTKATGKNTLYSFESRRPGDIPEFYANPTKALNILGWKTEKTIEQACFDSWKWQSNIT